MDFTTLVRISTASLKGATLMSHGNDHGHADDHGHDHAASGNKEAVTVFVTTFIVVALIFIAFTVSSWTWNMQWFSFIIMYLVTAGGIGAGTFLIMNSDSPSGKVGISAIVGMVLIGIGVLIGGLTVMPYSWQDGIRNVFGNSFSPNAPQIAFDGASNVDIDLKDPATGIPRDADVIYIQIEAPGDTRKFDLNKTKKVRVFFKDAKTGQNSLAREIVR